MAWLTVAINFASADLPDAVPSAAPAPAPTAVPSVSAAPTVVEPTSEPTAAPTSEPLPPCDDSQLPKKWSKRGKTCDDKRKWMQKRAGKVCANKEKWVQKKFCQLTCFELGEPWAYGECPDLGGGIVDSGAGDDLPDCVDERPPKWIGKRHCSTTSKITKIDDVTGLPKFCSGDAEWRENRYCEKSCWHAGEPFRYDGNSRCGDSTFAGDP